MKILLINYEYPPIGGGAANATKFLAREFVNLGHEVVVITSAYKKLKGITEENKVKIYRIPAIRKYKDRSNILQMLFFIFSAIINAKKILKNENPEYSIAFFTIPGGPVSYFLKKIYNIPYIISLRGGDVPGTEKKIESIHKLLAPFRRLFLKNARAIIANSKGLAELSMKSDPYPVQVIPNGVDCDFFKPTLEKNNNNYIYLFVGRFQEQKNLFLLLEQFAKIQEINQKVELWLVGDGPLRSKLEERAVELKIDKSITWYGWMDKKELKTIYQKANCLINPSLYEGMPNTVLEAMASGLPVIASDIFGNNDLVVHKETGFLFSLENPNGLSQWILKLAENFDLSNKLGIAARHKVETEFSWTSVAKKYLEILIKSTP